MTQTHQTQVLFNAECPVCNYEIRAYERHAMAQGLPIRFDDLNTTCAAWGIDADTAARRLYVLHQGQLTSGIAAFLVLWSQMPRYRWLGRVVGLPVVRPLAEVTYDRILAPLIYRWHLRRKRRQGASVSRDQPGNQSTRAQPQNPAIR
jgi:predicted DCC family thiol-disulfide oxidoreductase YuxK